MNSERAIVEQLMKLGLTQYEAQVFITMVTQKAGTAAQISQVSRVPRPKVYETLNSLAEKGLITVIEGTPTAYVAVNLDIALKILEKKYIDALENFKKMISTVTLSQSHEMQQGVYFVKNADTLMQLLIDAMYKAQRSIIILDSIAQLLYNKKFQEAIQSINQRGIIMRVLSRREYIEQFLSDLVAELFYIDTEVYAPNDSYVLIDNSTFFIKYYTLLTSGSFYNGAYGNHNAFLVPIRALVQSIEQKTKASEVLTKQINPLDHVKILKSETSLFNGKINYLDPTVINYDYPYQAFVVVTEDRIILTSLLSEDVQVIAIPRRAIFGIDIASIPGVGRVVRLQYTKMGQSKSLLIGTSNPDELVRALVSLRHT